MIRAKGKVIGDGGPMALVNGQLIKPWCKGGRGQLRQWRDYASESWTSSSPLPPWPSKKEVVLRSQINRLKCAGYVSGSAHTPDLAINQEIFYYAKTAATLIGT
jgi:hypothetical protein